MAVTTLLVDTAEHGSTASSGGGLYSVATGNIANVTTSPRNGLRCLEVTPTATVSGRFVYVAAGSPAKGLIRLGISVPVLPSSGRAFLCGMIPTAGGANKISRLTVDSTGLLEVGVTGSTWTAGPTISANTWFLLEMRVDVSGTTWTVEWKVNGTTRTTHSETGQAADTINTIRVGTASTTGPAYTARYDDIIFGSWTDTADWYGDGKGLILSPNADGAHSGAINFTKSDVLVAYWELLEELPMAGGDYYEQTLADGTAYIETAFGDTTETSFNAVRAVFNYRSSTTTANHGKTVVRRSGGTETVVFDGDMSETSIFYKTVLVAVPSGGWTQAEVNALVMRGGYSTNVASLPWWQGMQLEVDVPITVGAAKALAGVAASAASATAPVARQRPIAGVASIAAQPAGPLTRAQSLTAVAAAASQPVALLARQTALTAVAPLVAATTAPLARTQAMAGTAPAAITTSAPLGRGRPLAGVTASVVTATTDQLLRVRGVSGLVAAAAVAVVVSVRRALTVAGVAAAAERTVALLDVAAAITGRRARLVSRRPGGAVSDETDPSITSRRPDRRLVSKEPSE